MVVRHADAARDGAACAAIYAPSVTDGVASFEEVAPDAAEMTRRIAASRTGWPWLVAEAGDGAVAGFAYGSRHRARAAYRWTVDVSVYVAADHRRRGVGATLYGRLLTLLRDQGFHVACAGISLPNPASVALHESVGFVAVGVYRDVGFKLGRWCDVGWWQLALREPDPGRPPLEPGPPVALDHPDPGP